MPDANQFRRVGNGMSRMRGDGVNGAVKPSMSEWHNCGLRDDRARGVGFVFGRDRCRRREAPSAMNNRNRRGQRHLFASSQQVGLPATAFVVAIGIVPAVSQPADGGSRWASPASLKLAEACPNIRGSARPDREPCAHGSRRLARQRAIARAIPPDRTRHRWD